MIQNIFLNLITNLINVFLDFLYPENISCILCDCSISKNTTYSMCKDCFSNINFILDGCIKCGKPIINYSLEEQSIDGCSYCLNKSFYFDKVISCVEYTEISKKIVFGLKYNNKTYLSKYIATIMKEKLDLENIKFDYILFVPLHKKRLRQRGFNQAEKIAMDLSKIVDIPTVDNISRKYNTKRLYKLGKEERINELKNAFDLSTSKKMDDNYQEFLDKMDDFISIMQGKPTMFLGNNKLITKIKGIARRAGYYTKSEDAFGRSIEMWDNMPLVDLEEYFDGVNTTPCVKISEDGLTDLYAVQIAKDGFHGVSPTGTGVLSTCLPDMKAPGTVKEGDVEMVAAVVLKNTLKAGVFRNIKVK